jgi:hypothetical protein
MYDPALIGGLTWIKQSQPDSHAALNGVSVLNTRTLSSNLSLQQGFSTGTQYAVSFTTSSENTNSTTSSYNPFKSGTLGLTVTQPLLRGFGVAVNRRYILIAENDKRISRLVFRQQLINVAYGIRRQAPQLGRPSPTSIPL